VRCPLPGPRIKLSDADVFPAAEVFGYYARAWASDEPDKVGPFLLQNLLILAAPPFLAATIYMSLGRVLTALGAQRHSLVKPSWITKIYVIIDFGCIVTQLVGSAILGSGDASAVTTSKTMILSGLIAQLVALSFFVVNCWHVYRRCASDPFLGSEKQDLSFVWQNHFRAIMLVALVMIVRSAVRMAEYLQGSDGFIASHEVFIYVFDAFPMLLVMIVFLVIHPGRLVRDARVELGKYNRASSGSIMLQNQTF